MAAGVCLWALAVAAIACAVKRERNKRLAAANDGHADEETGKNGDDTHQRETGGEGGIEEEDSHTTSNPVPLTLAGETTVT